MRTLIKKLIAWLEGLADEGKRDMNVIEGEVVTTAEGTVHPDVYLGGGQPLELDVSHVASLPPASQSMPAVDQVLGKIKDLLDLTQQPVKLWDDVATVAKALHSDVPSVVAKIKELLEWSAQPVKAFDEIATLAIKLVPG